MARWSFEEGSAAIALDSSDAVNTGALSAPPGVDWDGETPDQSRYSVRFDGGSNDRIDLGGLDIGSDAMSITLWFKAEDFDTHDARFISKASGQNDSDHYWMVSTLNESKLRFRLKAGGTTETLISSAGTLTADVWTHVAAVYDGTKMTLYKNGAAVASTPKSGSTNTNPSVKAAIGNQPDTASGGARPFDGVLDEVRIYSRALVPAEILAIRDATPPMTVVGYVSWTASQGLGQGNDLASEDPDFDGLVNLLEYGLSLSPTAPDHRSPIESAILEPVEGQQHLALTFRARKLATDLIYLVQVSDDLSSWSDAARYTSNGNTLIRNAATATEQAVFEDQGDAVKITERDVRELGTASTNTQRRFMRLILLR